MSFTQIRYSFFTLVLIIFVGLINVNCEGPAGVDGIDGQDGARGPVGPAGEDGSMIYTGEGAPTGNIGNSGDYYLDSETGELYGPKEDSDWGDPIIVLMGEDGSDGEDGSQIYSGEGEPDESLGKDGDYYLDKENYDLYGPKTSSGWGAPLNLQGANSSPGVMRYIFPGHDFTEDMGNMDNFVFMELDLGEKSVDDYTWLAYMTNATGWKFQVPGPGTGSYESVSYYNFYFADNNDPDEPSMFVIGLVDGPGEVYDPIELVRIKITDETEVFKQGSGDSNYSDLDFSDYNEVSEYFGFYNN